MRCASAAPSPSLSRPITAKQVINEEMTEVKSVSVGAGAKIAQELEDDVLKLDQWDDTEKGIIRLYFVFEPEFKNIYNNGGVRDLNGDAAGYLNGLPVG